MLARTLQAAKDRPGLVALLTVFGAWGAWFIYRTSFFADGERVFCLFDDAMISMTYARNLVEGHGLNWARYGEPVEGFTCPLWTFYMASLHLLPVPLRLQALLVQITSLAVLAANIVAVTELARRHFAGERARYAIPAGILTASYYPLNHWSLQGMETGVQALLVTLAVLFALDTALAGRRREAPLFAVLAAAALLRLDMLILIGTVVAYLVLNARFAGPQLRRCVVGSLVVVASLLAYEIFRWVYFHDWLPNTYYLKMTGLPAGTRILRGLLVFRGFLDLAAIPLALAALGSIPMLRRQPGLGLPLAVVVLYLGYSIYVGGDAWEWSNVGANRFQVIVMPLVFAMLTGVLNQGIDAVNRLARGRFGRGGVGLSVVVPVTLVCALLANGLWATDRAGERWRNILVLDLPLHVEQNREIVRGIRRLSREISPEAKMLTVWAGIPAYFSDFRMADTLGYNDRYIARLDHVQWLSGVDHVDLFKPGHNKLDYAYSLGTVRPDLVFQTFRLGKSEPELMRRYGFERRYGVWVRGDSQNLER